jgi:RNA polymerase sigma factor (sigma-70 family)
MSEILQHLRRIVFRIDAGKLTDGQLLDDFIHHRAPESLAALVHRHGPMVWGVCSRTLGNISDAEDAFQSTFLVFARKAASVTPKEMIGNWLYGVARQTALNARAAAGRRRNKERPVIDMPQPPSNDPWGELLPHLDHELGCLPHKYRAVIVLCDLEGKTRGEAAQQLRLPEGTVASQLARGRAMLAKRMARHGAKITTAGMAAFLARSAVSANTPPAIVSSTINAVVAVAEGKAAANVVSANVAALTEGVVKTMFLRQLKAVTVAFLVLLTSIGVGVTFLAAHFSDAAQQVPPPPVPKIAAAPEKAAKDRSDVEPMSDDEPKGEAVTIRGRVLDVDGKPAAGAEVAAIGRLDHLSHFREPPTLLEGKADQEGRFQLVLPARISSYFNVCLVAKTAGRSVRALRLDADSWGKEAELRLKAEDVFRGQLIDLQGQPAVGVRIGIGDSFVNPVIYDVGRTLDAISDFSCIFSKTWNSGRTLDRWRMSATTDEQGRFALPGLSAGWEVVLEADDNRFAPEQFVVPPIKNGTGFVGVLAPRRVLEVTVNSAVDGKPVRNADVRVGTHSSGSGLPRLDRDGRTDENGRVRIALPAGIEVSVAAAPPAGTALLNTYKFMTWPNSGTLKQEMTLKLPQGVLVRGTVTETPSGKPVPKAKVIFEQNRDDNPDYLENVSKTEVLTEANGKFEIVVPPGRGHVLVDGRSQHFIHREIGTNALFGGGGYRDFRYYYDGIIPYQLKPNSPPHDVSLKLQRGVTLRGHLVGPDGQPVPKAMMLCRSYLVETINGRNRWGSESMKRVVDGRFALPGCDPEKTSEIFFVDERDRCGAVVKLSGRDADKLHTVQLVRCGSVKVRLVDEKGNPLPQIDSWVNFEITPGERISNWRLEMIEAKKRQTPRVMEEVACAPYDTCRGNTDNDGRITFHCLIPGAKYTLGGQGATTGGMGLFRSDIRVEPGQTLDLGDVQVTTPKR